MRYEVGDKVRFKSARGRKKHPEWYPEVGTVGTVVRTYGTNLLWVMWPKGSTCAPGSWGCSTCYVEAAKGAI